MISNKLNILKRLTTHLQAITPDWTDLPAPMQGIVCPYNLSQSVYRGRLLFGKEVALPYLSIFEPVEQAEPLSPDFNVPIEKEDWLVLIQGFVADDRDNPTDPAYDLLAWVQMRLARLTLQKSNGAQGGVYPNEYLLGRLISRVQFHIPIVRPGRDTVSDKAYFYLPLTLGNVTDLSMPFTQET